MAAVLSLAAACSAGTREAQPAVAEAPGTLELNSGPLNDAPLGGGGNGTLYVFGRTYRFTIGGEGVFGDAIANLQTAGEVHRLSDIAAFPGSYRRAPAGEPGQGLWLQNQ